MIVDVLVVLVCGLIESLLSLVPYLSFASPETAGFNIGGWLEKANGLLPVRSLFLISTAYVAFPLAMALWHLFEWVWAHIPFKAA